ESIEGGGDIRHGSAPAADDEKQRNNEKESSQQSGGDCREEIEARRIDADSRGDATAARSFLGEARGENRIDQGKQEDAGACDDDRIDEARRREGRETD